AYRRMRAAERRTSGPYLPKPRAICLYLSGRHDHAVQMDPRKCCRNKSLKCAGDCAAMPNRSGAGEHVDPLGDWSTDDYTVLADRAVVGSIMKARLRRSARPRTAQGPHADAATSPRARPPQ